MWPAISAIVAALAVLTTWILRRRDKSTAVIEYSIDRSTPIKVDSQMVGVFNLRVRCRAKIAEDVTVHLSANYASIQLQDAHVPTGLEYKFETEGERARIIMPNFQDGDELAFVLMARGSFVAEVMKVVIRSPKEIRIRQIGQPAAGAWLKELLSGIVVIIASAIIIYHILIFLMESRQRTDNIIKDAPQSSGTVRDITRVNLTEAAEDAGLDALVTLYAQSPDPQYYSAGDVAVSRASLEKSPTEKEKYRVFLSLVLKRVAKMAPESKAHILLSRAKIDIELNKADEALSDFRASKSLDPAWVNEKVTSDPSMAALNK